MKYLVNSQKRAVFGSLIYTHKCALNVFLHTGQRGHPVSQVPPCDQAISLVTAGSHPRGTRSFSHAWFDGPHDGLYVPRSPLRVSGTGSASAWRGDRGSPGPWTSHPPQTRLCRLDQLIRCGASASPLGVEVTVGVVMFKSLFLF